MSIRKDVKMIHVCDFCGKDETQVAHMICAGDVNTKTTDICGDCVDLAAQAVSDLRAGKTVHSVVTREPKE